RRGGRMSAPLPLPLPENPDLDWLKKQAKRHLDSLQAANPEAILADAQLQVARRYGFSSWRALKAHIDALSVDGRLKALIKAGDVAELTRLLDADPSLLHWRFKPYEWTLLHTAADEGQLAIVDLLLRLRLDV